MLWFIAASFMISILTIVGICANVDICHVPQHKMHQSIIWPDFSANQLFGLIQLYIIYRYFFSKSWTIFCSLYFFNPLFNVRILTTIEKSPRAIQRVDEILLLYEFIWHLTNINFVIEFRHLSNLFENRKTVDNLID